MTGWENLTFDNLDPEKYEKWYETKEGLYFDRREKELIIEMINPELGESLIEIGCGTGHFLKWLKTFELKLTGIDSSKTMIEYASKNLDRDIKLKVEDAKNLSFKDNSFDIAVFITTLEFLDNPGRAIKEALRISKKRVFIGFLNKLSLLAIKHRIKGLFKDSIYNKATFYSVFQIEKIIRSINDEIKVTTRGIKTKLGSGSLYSPFVGVLIEK